MTETIYNQFITKPDLFLTFYNSLSNYEKARSCVIVNNIIEFEKYLKNMDSEYKQHRDSKPVDKLAYYADIMLDIVRHLPYDDCIKYMTIILNHCPGKYEYASLENCVKEKLTYNKEFAIILIDVFIIMNNIDNIYNLLFYYNYYGINSINNDIILLILNKIATANLINSITYINKLYNAAVARFGNSDYYKFKYNNYYLREIIFLSFIYPYKFVHYDILRDYTNLIDDIKEFTNLMKRMTINRGISLKAVLKMVIDKELHLKTMIKYMTKLNIIIDNTYFDTYSYSIYMSNLGLIPIDYKIGWLIKVDNIYI